MTTPKPVLKVQTQRAFDSLMSTLQLSAESASELAESFAKAERDGIAVVTVIREMNVGYKSERWGYNTGRQLYLDQLAEEAAK